MNIKVYDGIKKLDNRHPILVRGGTIIATIVLIVTLVASMGGKQETQQVFPTMPPKIVTPAPATPEPTKTEPIHYDGFDIRIGQGTRMRLEPSQEGAYVETINGDNRGNLIAMDGDYALVSHRNPGDSYTRLGFVPADSVVSLSGNKVYPEANNDGKYVHFTNSTRIRTEMDESPEARNILTTAKKGDYARIIGTVLGPEWSNETWYVVTYGNYIGYMQGENGDFISEEQMEELVTRGEDFIRITGTQVNFRSEPSMTGNVITQLNKGDTLKIIGDTGEWYCVSLNGTIGYLSKTLKCFEIYNQKLVPNGITNLHFNTEAPKTR